LGFTQKALFTAPKGSAVHLKLGFQSLFDYREVHPSLLKRLIFDSFFNLFSSDVV